MTRAVAVINPVPFIRRDDGFFMNPDETNALRCWTDHFQRTLLLKPELVVDEVPDGWLPLPGEVEVEPLFAMPGGRAPSLPARRRGTREAVARSLDRAGHAYLRAPNWECTWSEDLFRDAGLPLLVELFGDWETTFYSEWERPWPKRLLRGPISRWADRNTRRMAQGADALCCMGEALREKYAGGQRAWVTTAHLVPEKRFLKRADTCQSEPIRLLYVGVLSARKGLTHLVDAVGRLASSAPAVHLDVIGDGPQQPELVAHVRGAGLDDAITFHGRIAHGERLLDFFRQADVFVLPSVGAEGLPRVIQEALSMSCPVVATDVGSVRYQLGEGRFGAVVPPGDAAALADAIGRVVRDGDHRRALIAHGFEEAGRYSFERQWSTVGDILRECVDSSLLDDEREPPALD